MCKNGYVDAVLGEDTDVLAYGAPIFITHLDIHSGNVIVYHHQSLLKALDMNHETFLDMCIGCQCDYNGRLKKKGARSGYGPMSIYKLIIEHKVLEEVEEVLGNEVDFSILNYRRCREIFTLPKRVDYISKALLLMKRLNDEDLEVVFGKLQLKTKLDYVRGIFSKVEIIITNSE